MASKWLKELRRSHRRGMKRLKKPLIPRDWHEWSNSGDLKSTKLKDEWTQEARQAYYNACYGNLYIKQDYRGQQSGNQCMLVRTLVGSGNYTSFQFVDMVAHKKFEESHDHSVDPQVNFGAAIWYLVAEMNVDGT